MVFKEMFGIALEVPVGLSFSAAVGSNGGSLIGNSFGGMLTLRKTGRF